MRRVSTLGRERSISEEEREESVSKLGSWVFMLAVIPAVVACLPQLPFSAWVGGWVACVLIVLLGLLMAFKGALIKGLAYVVLGLVALPLWLMESPLADGTGKVKTQKLLKLVQTYVPQLAGSPPASLPAIDPVAEVPVRQWMPSRFADPMVVLIYLGAIEPRNGQEVRKAIFRNTNSSGQEVLLQLWLEMNDGRVVQDHPYP